jgi:GT2 family glycosyltransferase
MLKQNFFHYSKDVAVQYNLELVDRVFPTEKKFQTSGLAGWRGGLIDDYSKAPNLIPTEIKNSETRPIYVGEVIMRGPLCFRKSDLMKLGYLNQDAFFLGYDEIDLSLRAWMLLGKRVAFMPIYLFSPAEWGSTRKPKSLWLKFFLWSRFVARSKRFRDSLAYELISSPDLRKQTSVNLKKEVRRTIPTQ